MTLLCNDLVWKYLALRHWTGVFCSTQSFIISIPHLQHTKMDDSITPKKWSISNSLWLFSVAREAPQPLIISDCTQVFVKAQSPPQIHSWTSLLSSPHQEPPPNIEFVFIRSDWNNQLYRRVWGTFLPSLDKDTNQSKSWHLPVKVMVNKSRSGCVMRVSVEGGCSQCCWVWRWHSEGLQGCDLPLSHASHVNANTRTNCCCFLIIWPRINLCVCCILWSIKASGDLSPMRVVGVCVCVKGVTL